MFSEVEPMFSIEVRLRSDAAVAAALSRRYARDHGLTAQASAEVAVVVSELATNLVRHAGGRGWVELWREAEWLFIRSRDRGPGMADPSRFFAGREGRPGPLPGESLGEGGAAVRRLTDDVQVANREGGGFEVLARKRVVVQAKRRHG
ncbi:ATP-binding protein [Myxococcus xanthus]|uniref:ATP-binding protein n=1 Tax=Myxococcus xanthus TaxID=34 RepID=UPI001126D08D|nr:ATP-binding protein [Myxococcus xanthus]QDE96726.1 histidine kinase [Myxococcus xanthus]